MSNMKFFNSSSRFRLLSGMVLAVSLAFFSFKAADDFFDISKSLDIFTSVYREINLNYVDKVKAEELMEMGIQGMFSTLDPYTEFIPESEIEDFKLNYVSTQYGGIGALIVNRDSSIYISEIYEGFPAWEAGLRAGDEILQIDDTRIRGKATKDVTQLLKGSKDSALTLVVKRPGKEKPIEKNIKRGNIHFDNVSYYGMLNRHTGYIKLDKFLENASDEIKEAFLSLKDQRARSLILDLRGNGGGILQEAVKIVSFFVNKNDTVVSQRGRDSSHLIVYHSQGHPLDRTIPLVILVDKNTASASEIVAGALQDLDRAAILGQRTFGKGLVQQTLRMPYNSLLKMTIAKYYTPSGRCIQALDYAHRQEDGSVIKIPDSLITEYSTRNGRKVYDGSGIFPDITVEPKKYHPITHSIADKYLHFDYATRYRNQHNKIPPVESFEVDDAIYDDFTAWLDEKGFTYRAPSERLMEQLKEAAGKEKRYEEIEPEYNALLSKLTHNKQDDLQKFRPEIKELLENEIISRYYYQKGRIRSSLKYDRHIQESMRILNTPELYASILEGEGTYKTIGRPTSLIAQAPKLPENTPRKLPAAVDGSADPTGKKEY